MKNAFRKLAQFAGTVYVRAAALLTTYAVSEPVRFRAILTSLVVAGGTVVPALANGSTASLIAGLGTAALVAFAGESARAKVSPVSGE